VPDRVVMASHEMTRTGAPMSLLHVLRWLVANTDLEVEVIVARLGEDGGSMLDEFASVAPTRVAPRLFAAGRGPRVPACSVLYLNSIFAAGCLAHLPRHRPYIISRVPELSMPFRHWFDAEERSALLAQTDRFLAVSRRVAKMLVEEYDVAEDRIAVVHGSVDLSGVRRGSDADRAEQRRQLGIPDDALVVGAAGTTDWRKGPDLFVRMAKAVQERSGGRPVHFIWLGGERGGPEFWQVESRILGASIGDRVHFLGSRPDPYSYYELMDVFTLTSREDPFPRVCMEVAAMGVPIVTFDNGGATELVSKGCGFVVPYLDVEAMTDRVVELLEAGDLRSRLGAVGAAMVRAEHTVEIGGPATLAEIERGLRAVRER